MIDQQQSILRAELRQKAGDDAFGGGARLPVTEESVPLAEMPLSDVRNLLEQLRPNGDGETLRRIPFRTMADLELGGLIRRMSAEHYLLAKDQIAGLTPAERALKAASAELQVVKAEQQKLETLLSSDLHRLLTRETKLEQERLRLKALPHLVELAARKESSCRQEAEKLKGLSAAVRSAVPCTEGYLRLSEEGRSFLQDSEHFQHCSSQLSFSEFRRQINISERVFSIYLDISRRLAGRDMDHGPALTALVCDNMPADEVLQQYEQITRAASHDSIAQAPALVRVWRRHPKTSPIELLKQHAELKDATLLSLVLDEKCSRQSAIEYRNSLSQSDKLQIKTNAPALAGIGLSTGRTVEEMLGFHNSVRHQSLALVWLAALRGTVVGIDDSLLKIQKAAEITPYFDHAFPLTLLGGFHELEQDFLLAHYARLRSKMPAGRIDDAPGLTAKVLALCTRESRPHGPAPETGTEGSVMFDPAGAIAWDLLDNGILDGSGLAFGGVL